MHLGDHYIALNIYFPTRGEMQDMSGTVCWGGGGGGGGGMKTGELYTLVVEAHKLVKEDSFCSSCGCVLVQVDLPAGGECSR